MQIRVLFSLTAALAYAAFTAELAAQNSVMTYQGRVQSGGSDFTGTGRFKFALVTSTNLNLRASAEATVSGGFVTVITPIDLGTSYLTAPAVTIVGGGGSGATATASISNGMVTQYVVNSPGSGYISIPTVVVEPPPENLLFATFWSNDGTSVDGGEPVDAVTVQVDDGLFAVSLGDTSVPGMDTFEADTFGQPNLELRIWFDDGVNGFAALSPAQPLAAAPYALKVPEGAVTGMGTPDGSNTNVVTVDNNGEVHIGVSSHRTGSTLHVVGQRSAAIRGETSGSLGIGGNGPQGVVGLATSGSGRAYGVRGEADSSSGIGVSGVANSGTGTTYGVFGGISSPDGYGVYGTGSGSGVGYAGFFHGRFTVQHFHTGVESWPVRIDNQSHAAHKAGMRVSNDGFFDVTNDAEDASPNFARLDNTGNWTSVSDRRSKRDVQPLSGTLDRAMALEPVSFLYKNGDIPSKDKHIGFIAQDVRKQFPSLVTNGDVLTLNYAGLSVVAISALQELHKVVEEKDARVADLMTRLERVEAVNQKLEQKEAQIATMESELSELQKLVSTIMEKGNR